MVALAVSWCHGGGHGPCLCRRPRHDHPDGRRELLVATGLGEGVLIPAGNAAVKIVGGALQWLHAPDRHEQVKMPVFLPVFCLAGGLWRR